MANKPYNIKITPRRNDTSEKIIRRFNRKVKKSGILEKVKKRRYYEKPSVVRRKQKIARKRTLERLKQKEKGKKRTNYRRR
tara:strand:+ start:85 stop:327 length:243 start_codon:yes stop_codon:yes gene_type:complete